MKNKLRTILKFFIPFSIWGFLFEPFFSGQAVISSETLHIYSVVKFTIDNLKLGIFPLWDPFVMWGTPTQIFLNYVGIFNPMWLLILLFNALGLSVYQSFICVLAIYFWAGQLGFYLLAKMILKDAQTAYFAFLLFLFSSVSMTLFAQFHPQLLYIPSIWFFYFLLSFFKKPSRLALAGLTLSAAVILTSYLPFYFLTVLTFAIFPIIIFFYLEVRSALPRMRQFILENWLHVLLSGVIVTLAFMPGFQAYQSTANKEITAPFRNGNVEQKAGVDFSDYDQVAKNGLTTRMILKDLYSNLDIIVYGDDCFFYVSIFFYLVLILGAPLQINRTAMSCALTALPLFFLMLTWSTGFHRFAFEHIPYFKLIRNMHFFLPFFMATIILLASELFRSIMENKKIFLKANRALLLFWVVTVHTATAIFLCKQDYVILSSYLALGFSFLFWIFIIFSKRLDQSFLTNLLFLCIIAQPAEVIWRHNQRAPSLSTYPNKNIIESCIKTPSIKPVFSYTRPVSNAEIGNDDTAKSRITMTDISRFYGNGFPTYWSSDLDLKEPLPVLQKYTRYKFHLYANAGNLTSGSDFDPTSAITGPSEQFRVTGFSVNSVRIRTDYPQEKYLVYTDSYHKGWEALINGRNAQIDRANVAFKGLRLPPGTNEIEFRFSPAGVKITALLLVLIFILLFITLIWLWRKDLYGQNKTSS